MERSAQCGAEAPLRGRRLACFWALCALVAAVLGGFGFRNLQEQDALPDELLTSASLRKEPFRLIEQRFENGHPPLYFLALQALTGGQKHSDRGYVEQVVPSVILAILCVPVIAAIGLRYGLGFWALLPAALWAAHPSVWFYGRLARPYSGACFIALIQLYAWLRLGQSQERAQSRWLWILFLTGLVGIAWNHMLAASWAILALLWLWFPAMRRTYRSRTFAVVAVILVGHASLWILTALQEYDPLNWVRFRPLHAWAKDIVKHFAGEWGSGQLGLCALGLAVALSVVWLGAALWLVRVAVRRKQFQSDPQALFTLTVVALAVLPLAGMVVTHLLIKPVVQTRYLLMYLAPLLIVCAIAGRAMRRRYVALILIAGAAAASAIRGFDETSRHQYGVRRSIARLGELYVDGEDGVLLYDHTLGEALRLFGTREFRLVSPARDLWRGKGSESDIPDSLREVKQLWLVQFLSKPPMPPESDIPSALGDVTHDEQIRSCRLLRRMVRPPQPR